MECLNQRAFEILKAEVNRCAADDPVGTVQKEIAWKRLERLRSQTGKPATEEELRDLVDDLFPQFNPAVLKAADRANKPALPALAASWQYLKWGVIFTTTVIGGIWVLNLPFPPIRHSVARIAPILLLPSFIDMDHHYRQAIAHTEQADQLVNHSTSAADLELGKTKVKTAQRHLDALPVWFLGYYPQFYCHWMSCGWRFTLDEFEQARKQVARMDARLFQEKNAQDQLHQADQVIATAKQQYQAAKQNPTQQQAAIAQWQTGMDQLAQISSETLAGRMAKTKLIADQRDFEKVSGFSAGSGRTALLMNVAKVFAQQAAQADSNRPHSIEEWQQIEELWGKAIAELNKITDQDPDYLQSRQLLATYAIQLNRVKVRLAEQKQSEQAYERAQKLTEILLSHTQPLEHSQMVKEFYAIENELTKVRPKTTVYPEAQRLGQQAETKRKQLLRESG